MSLAQDVETGLSATKKFLPSKYFYDEEGDRLFQQIMKMPEYYLTDCEYEIFSTRATEILKAVSGNGHAFELVEFGAGDGFKTKILIRRLLEQNANFRYRPIDISGAVLKGLESDLKGIHPELEVLPHNNDYFQALEQINLTSSYRKLILFIGSSVGNFTEERTKSFLSRVYEKLNSGDQFLIGYDLQKNPKTILAAYNDAAGVTKAFNINLLRRINRELEANFQLDAFDHYPVYDPDTGKAKSYLVSLKNQEVEIKKLGKKFSFKSGETIHTEISQKYQVKEMEEFLQNAGFRIIDHFYDCKHYYVDTLAVKP